MNVTRVTQKLYCNKWGLEKTKTATTPGVPGSRELRDESDANPLLEGTEASLYRGIVARLNFMSLDRPDLLYASKEASRYMANPRKRDWEPIRRICQYLKYQPRATLQYVFQAEPTEFTVFSDTDWAGDKSTRKSTSGGIILHGSHFIKGWSRQQSLVALSSAEAELYGTVKGSSEALGIRSNAMDLGMKRRVRLYADASAALGVIHRQGLGKLRHVDTHALWVQQAALMKKIQYLKVAGTKYPADALTKHLSEPIRNQHFAGIGMQFLTGRAQIAPMLANDKVEKE